MQTDWRLKWYATIAIERQKNIAYCFNRKHSKRETNKDGYCTYCNTEFILYKKVIETINMLQKRIEIIALKKTRVLFIVDKN